jgi:hypothetical protein
MLLALKTSKEGYHVYKHGEHNHSAIKAIEDEKGEEEEMEEEEDDENGEEEDQEKSMEVENETEDGPNEHERGNMGGAAIEVDGIEFPLEKCQRTLNSALQKGHMERAKKWMGRIDDETKIGQIVAEMNVENMTKLVGMANSDIGISKRRYKSYGVQLQFMGSKNVYGSNEIFMGPMTQITLPFGIFFEFL